jgi:hypothetical protein
VVGTGVGVGFPPAGSVNADGSVNDGAGNSVGGSSGPVGFPPAGSVNADGSVNDGAGNVVGTGTGGGVVFPPAGSVNADGSVNDGAGNVVGTDAAPHTIDPDTGVAPRGSGGAPSADLDVLGMPNEGQASPVGARAFDPDPSPADVPLDQAFLISPETDLSLESAAFAPVDLGDLGVASAVELDDFVFADQVDPGGAELLEGSLPGDADGDGFVDT